MHITIYNRHPRRARFFSSGLKRFCLFHLYTLLTSLQLCPSLLIKYGINRPHLVDAILRRYSMRLTCFKAITQVGKLIRELMDRVQS